VRAGGGRPALASAGADGTVHLWDPASDDRLRLLEGHTDAVNGVCALVVDGRPLLATASSDQTVVLWDAVTGEQLRVLHGHTDEVFGVAKKRGLIFANPTTHLATTRIDPGLLLPMTDAQIRAVQRVAVNPAQRLIVALAAVHAARIAAIRHLLLDALDLPNRRIIIAGHTQRLGELTDRALRAWLQQRRLAAHP
jgi:WD domain, G-beta repeat